MNDFWDKKRVLVIGHSGFKGLWLSAILKNFGAEVHGVSFSKENNNHDFYDLNKKDMFHEEHDIDISDPKKIKMLLSDHDFEIIFHLLLCSTLYIIHHIAYILYLIHHISYIMYIIYIINHK